MDKKTKIENAVKRAKLYKNAENWIEYELNCTIHGVHVPKWRDMFFWYNLRYTLTKFDKILKIFPVITLGTLALTHAADLLLNLIGVDWLVIRLIIIVTVLAFQSVMLFIDNAIFNATMTLSALAIKEFEAKKSISPIASVLKMSKLNSI